MAKDGFGKDWITEKGQEILNQYTGGITVRQLYYRLVTIGMPNGQRYYKRVVNAMTDARWKGIVNFYDFIDRERSTFWMTKAEPTDLDEKVEEGIEQVRRWMQNYRKNRWENQPEYIEVWIEKKALQGVFEDACLFNDVRLAPCKGYPSLTFIYDALGRFQNAKDRGQKVTILYFGDFDPSGSDIPRSLKENLSRMGCNVNMEHWALNEEQIAEYNLPGVPPKSTDSRTGSWDGDSAVELDAMEPKILAKLAVQAIKEHFDDSLYSDLKDQEKVERGEYQDRLQKAVEESVGLFSDEDDEDDE